MVDLKTGNIFDGIPTAHGQDYRINSRLIILDPPEKNGEWTDDFLQGPAVYEWKHNKFHLLYKETE